MSKPAVPLTWCLVLMFEVVGPLQGKQNALSLVPMWGNTQSSASSSSSARGICTVPGEQREISARFRAAQTCWATLMLGFPSPLQLRSLSVWSPCVLLGGEGEERKQGLCQGIAAGRGAGAAPAQIPLGFMSFFCFCFLFYFAFSFNSPLLSRSHGITEMNPSPGSLPRR